MPKILVGIDRGDYTFDASAKTITFSNMGDVSLEQIRLITNATDNVIIYQFNDPLKGGSLASNVLTLDYDTTTMDDTDVLAIDFSDIDLTLDTGTGTQKTTEQAPVYSQNWVDKTVEETNLAIGTHYFTLPAGVDDVRACSHEVITTGTGITITLLGTNDTTLSDVSDSGWNDDTQLLWQVASITGEQHTVKKIDTPLLRQRLMLKVVITDATNTLDLYGFYSKV